MREDANPSPLVSEPELTRLTQLFVQFHAAFDPLAREAKEARVEFHKLISEIYARVPDHEKTKYTSVTFEGIILLVCKRRASKGPSTI
jgi:hypothetical protein